MSSISEKRFVGIDLHLHRSVIAALDEQGKQLGWVRIDNDPKTLVGEVRKVGGCGCGCSVAVEATYGWYWAVDALLAARFDVHLAHPSGMKALRRRKRVKTDARDAYELAQLMRLGSLPEAYEKRHGSRGAGLGREGPRRALSTARASRERHLQSDTVLIAPGDRGWRQ